MESDRRSCKECETESEMKSEFQIKFDLIEIFRQKKHERVADGEGGGGEGGGHERQEGCQHWQLQHVEGGGGGGQLAFH